MSRKLRSLFAFLISQIGIGPLHSWYVKDIAVESTVVGRIVLEKWIDDLFTLTGRKTET